MSDAAMQNIKYASRPRLGAHWHHLVTALGLALACVGTFAHDDTPVAQAASAVMAPTSAPIAAPKVRPAALGSVSRVRPPTPKPTLDQIPIGTAADIEAGRRIYREGILPSGEPLTGHRLDGEVKISGQTAACVLCHRRSGLGAVEGNNRISPISGRYLFRQDAHAVIQMNVRTERGFNRKHDPYTLETLAAAIRGGIHVSGHEMQPLMPRYDMSDQDIQVLASYLRQLSIEWSPGVTDTQIRFATVITPDVDPKRKQAFLETIRAIVHQRNGNIVHFGQRTMSSGAEMALMTNRSWDLEVWELQGAPETWAEQLKQRYAAKPVFAMISGLGANHWEPVHTFCESNSIPCWFPSVQQAPAEAEDGFYSIYFSRGLTLEADVLGRHLGEGAAKPKRVLQVYTDKSLGDNVIEPLRASLQNDQISSDTLLWDGRDKTKLKKAMARYGKADAVMFWLAPNEIQKLSELPLPEASIFFSGRLAQGESAPLNAQWKKTARLIYPYQLPELRRKGLTYFHQWINERSLNLVDEPLQSEVYFSLSYLVETLVDMLDNVHRDFLLERAENMLSLREAAAAESQARDVAATKQQVVAPDLAKPQRAMIPRPIPRPMPDREAIRNGPMRGMAGMREGQETLPMSASAEASMTGSRTESTTVYPRLSLAQFQRLASKGAYIVHFSDPAGTDLVADTPWIVP
ncbi:MAG: cytochrome c [Leptothrix sp. (in: b-proteobacteria)]